MSNARLSIIGALRSRCLEADPGLGSAVRCLIQKFMGVRHTRLILARKKKPGTGHRVCFSDRNYSVMWSAPESVGRGA
jgi:hypothetical protein